MTESRREVVARRKSRGGGSPSSGWINLHLLKSAGQEMIIVFVAAWVLIRQRRGVTSWVSLLGLVVLRLLFGAKLRRNRGLPGCLPFIGDQMAVFEVLRRGSSPFFREAFSSNGFKGIELNGILGLNAIIPTSRADLRYILKENWKNFPKNYDHNVGFDVAFNEVMGRGIFAVDGQEWRVHRKVSELAHVLLMCSFDTFVLRWQAICSRCAP